MTGIWYVRARNVRNVAVQSTKRLRHVNATAYVHPRARVARDLVLGDYAFVGPYCELDPGVEIGRYTMLAPHVAVLGDDHLWDVVGVPTQFAGRPPQRRTLIEDDVWIGYAAVVRRGVHIARGSIVAACSVVTHDVPRYAVVAGTPARVVRERFPDSADREAHDAVLDGPTVSPRFAGRLGAPSAQEVGR
jgi:acetyltransferase-like isoleucine patch superfamily enzyme